MNAQPLLATWTLTFHLGKHHEAVKTAVETVSQTHTSMFATLAALFAVGAVGFYLYLLLLSVVFTISVENDNGLAYFWSGIVAVIGIALYHAQLLALLTNWHLVALCFIAYGIAGGGNSVLRWFKYCRKYVEENPYHKRSKCRMEETPEEYYDSALSPREHKSQLVSWIIFWPWSLLWNCIGDFCMAIYDSLSGIYTKISKAAIRRSVKMATGNYNVDTGGQK